MKRLYGIIFSLALIAFTGYVLADTFLLTNSYQVVEEEKEKSHGEQSEKQEEIVFNDEYYKDDNIEIKITKTREYDTNIYIADVLVSDVEYLKTAFAKDTYGKNITEFTSKTAKSKNAILAVNGDFYGVQQKGYVLKNSKIYRSTSKGSKEDVVINKDGSFEIIQENKVKLSELTNAKELLSFGPALIKDGKISVTKNSAVYREKASNPRTAIAMVEPLHYIFLVSDGRTKESEGLSLYQLATFLSKYDVEVAYNLDGGGSSAFYFNGKIVNKPINKHKLVERKVSDIVYIGY